MDSNVGGRFSGGRLETAPAALEALGLSPQAATLYSAILTRGGMSRDDVSQVGPAAEARRALTELLSSGLVVERLGDGITYVVSAHLDAVDDLVDNRRAELDRARETLEDLVRDSFRAQSRERSADDYFEVVTGEAAVRRNHWAALDRAERHVVGFTRPPLFSVDAGDDAEVSSSPVLGRGIPVRWIWERSVLEMPGMLEACRSCVEMGEDLRTVPHLPMRMMVVDDRQVVIEVADAASTPVATALISRNESFVESFRTLFEFYWRTAIPVFGASVALASVTDDDDDFTRAMVAHLSSGAKDEVIARNLGVSARTLSRRLSELMSKLQVDNRFQAGLKLGKMLDLD